MRSRGQYRRSSVGFGTRLATGHCALLRRKRLSSLSYLHLSVLSRESRVELAIQRTLPFFSEDFAEIFRLTIDHLSDFTGATTTDATYVFEN